MAETFLSKRKINLQLPISKEINNCQICQAVSSSEEGEIISPANEYFQRVHYIFLLSQTIILKMNRKRKIQWILI